MNWFFVDVWQKSEGGYLYAKTRLLETDNDNESGNEYKTLKPKIYRQKMVNIRHMIW